MTQGVNIVAAQNFNPRGGSTKALDGLATLLAIPAASAFTDTSVSDFESKFGLLIEPLKEVYISAGGFDQRSFAADNNSSFSQNRRDIEENANAASISDEQTNAILASNELLATIVFFLAFDPFLLVANSSPANDSLAVYKRVVDSLCLPDTSPPFFDVPISGTTKGIPDDAYGFYRGFCILFDITVLILIPSTEEYTTRIEISSTFTPLFELLNLASPSQKVMTQLTRFLDAPRSAIGQENINAAIARENNGAVNILTSKVFSRPPSGDSTPTTEVSGPLAEEALQAAKDLRTYIQNPKDKDVVMVWRTFFNAASAAAGPAEDVVFEIRTADPPRPALKTT